jgi:hypothetical protein
MSRLGPPRWTSVPEQSHLSWPQPRLTPPSSRAIRSSPWCRSVPCRTSSPSWRMRLFRRHSAYPANWWMTGRTRPSPRWVSCWANTARCGLHGRLRALRRLLRQVPLLPGHRRPEEHAGGAPGSDAQGLPPLLHLAGKHFPKLVGAVDMTREVLDEWYPLLQPVLRVPPLLGVLPLRHRHRRGHHGRARNHGLVGMGQKYSNEIIGKVHKIGNNLGLPGPALENTLEGLEEDTKDDTGATSSSRSTSRAPRYCWSRRRPTSSPSPTSKA